MKTKTSIPGQGQAAERNQRVAAEHQRLDLYLDQARRGAPIETIAILAQTSLSTAIRWRTLRGIKPGNTPQQETVSALELFARPAVDHLHRAEESPVAGKFTPPQYVLRIPLDYSAFCRAAHALHTTQGFSLPTISAALGVRASDVEFALQIWNAHLRSEGVPCMTCGALIDPEFGPCCSRPCMEISNG